MRALGPTEFCLKSEKTMVKSFFDATLESMKPRLPKRRPKPKVANSPTDFMMQIFDVLDSVGWLGEGQFLPSTKMRKTPHNAIKSIPFVRRVLISCLAGRPNSEIAERVGCSDRTVYNVLDKVIYWVEEDPLGYWSDIGLIGVVDPPLPRFTDDAWDRFQEEFEDTYFEPTEAVIICQICHRVAGSIYVEPEWRTYQCDYKGPESVEWEEKWTEEAEIVRGHLLCHFPLLDDPLQAPGRRHNKMILEASGIDKKFAIHQRLQKAQRAYRIRSNWRDFIHFKALDILREWDEAGEEPLNPIREKKKLSRDETRRHWLGILKSDGNA